MGVKDLIDSQFVESLRAALPQGENIIKSELASWQVSKIKVVSVTAFLTNQRLILQDNKKAVDAVAIGAAIGGGVGGGLAGGAAASYAAAKSFKNGTYCVPLSDITGVIPSKFKLFGMFPNKHAVDIKLNTGETITVIFRNRDEWLTQFTSKSQNQV